MQRPRVKSVYPPLPMGNNLIQIGNGYGNVSEIEDDEQGHIWHLLQLLDGTRSFEELCTAMLQFDPSIHSNDVSEVLTTLIDYGFIEDAALGPPNVFSKKELDRYQRNFDFLSFYHLPGVTKYELQVRLKQSRVAVLGVGGLGSFVALSLAAMGIGELLIVDFDRVESSNMNRQLLYTERHIGMLKCHAATERLAEVNPHIQIRSLNLEVKSEEDARRCLTGQHFLVCAADRPRMTIYEWINAAAFKEGTAWLRGSNDGLSVSMFMHDPGKTSCYLCNQQTAYSSLSWYGPMVKYVKETFENQTLNPCIAPIAGMIGNMAALEVMKFLTRCQQPAIYDRMLRLDLRSYEINFFDGNKRASCPLCHWGEKGESGNA